MLTVGSLFAGIGGFDLGFARAGLATRWAVEIDPDCRRVLAARFPEAQLHEDVRQCGKANLEPVDVICGGFPCQDLSVAGKRAGLAGARSGLFYEMTRIVDELRPSFVVFENVPGLLSSNGGKDITAVLEEIERIRYIADLDILDAQYFGLAQRRRRLFIICQSAESFQKSNSVSSALTMAQCLCEIWRLILASRRECSPSSPSDSESREQCADGLRRRMKLFGLPGATPVYATLLNSWEEESLRSANEPRKSASAALEGSGDSVSERMTAMAISSAISDETASKSISSLLSTKMLWSDILEDTCSLASVSITSTRTSTTTESKIYTCALMLLRTARLICRLNPSSPYYWSAASSALTALKEFMSYARRATESLFGDMEWVCPWGDFLREAKRTDQPCGNTGSLCLREILALSARSKRDFAPGREAGADVAASLRSRSHSSGVNPPGRGGEDDSNLVIPAVANSVRTQDRRIGQGWNQTMVASAKRGSHACDHVGDESKLVCSDKGGSTWVEGRPTKSASDDNGTNHLAVFQCHGSNVGPMGTVRSGNGAVTGGVPFVAHALRAEGHDASEDGTGRGTPLAVVPIDMRQASRGETMTNNRGDDVASGGAPGTGIGDEGDPSPTLADSHTPVVGYIVNAAESCAKERHARETDTARCLDLTGGFASSQGGTVIGFHVTQDPISGDVAPAQCRGNKEGCGTIGVAFGIGSDAIDRSGEGAGGTPGERSGLNIVENLQPSLRARPNNSVATGMMVRRLTPVECCRLQGFPDNWLEVDPPLSDSAKYRALGNACAVPVCEWLGKRILEFLGVVA